MGMKSSNKIKSIQRGIVSIANGSFSNTATISSVNTANTELRILGVTCSAVTTPVSAHCKLILTNATTITAQRGANDQLADVGFELTEWY